MLPKHDAASPRLTRAEYREPRRIIATDPTREPGPAPVRDRETPVYPEPLDARRYVPGTSPRRPREPVRARRPGRPLTPAIRTRRSAMNP
ncbi:hypothetical protein [Lysobacter gummosus]|uniref:hypothetical protein n=1 Tax=Lysobacter gummosus TaxID=262324 RepID=UPI003639D915